MSSPTRHGPGWQRAFALVITTVLMVFLTFWAVDRVRQPGGAGNPGECITSLIQAAEEGDIPAYLDCFAGEMREKLEAEVAASRPPERFRESLRAGVAGMNGSATSDRKEVSSDESVLRWDRIYKGYVDRYRVRLRRYGGQWKITELDRIDRSTPAIPYGTPVYTMPPDVPED